MSFARWSKTKFVGGLVAIVSVGVFVVLMMSDPHTVSAQQATQAVRALPAGDTALAARGKYIVVDVAMCGTCHTPREPNGQLDHSRWLAGAPVPYLPAQARSDWPTVAPRLFGLPPASNAGMVTLLTTGVWITGKPLRDPMPKFHMTRADAEAVVAYLKSLPGKQ
jgi:mono/diheme cytochrome c family protein